MPVGGATTQPTARTGELQFLDNTVQGASGTIRLRAVIPNADRHFWPGQFLNIRLVLFEKKGALLVPNQAVQVGQQGPYIYVLKHDDANKTDLAELRPVTPGQKQGDLVVIDKGLEAGERVVVSGQMMVMPGGPVRVDQPRGPAVAQSGAHGGASASGEGKP